MVSRGSAIKLKSIAIVLLIAAGGAYYRWVFLPRHPAQTEAAYALPDSIPVIDTPAEVHLVVGELKGGDRVEVLARTRNWMRVRLADGRTGWVEAKSMLDSATYQAGQRLLKELAVLPVQAAGHLTAAVNLHLDPSRDAPQLALVNEKQHLEIFGRRLVERPMPPDQRSTGAPTRDAWYLVGAGSRAGWLLGRLVTLDVPSVLSVYAQDVNLVAWLVLDTIEDEGRQVPHYLVADRIGTQDFDFNHIRVFTWWKKRQTYATAYVESNLQGYFPIRVVRVNGIPCFRLRLTDEHQRKFQKVYGLFDTMTRPLGTVEGWETNAMPTRPLPKRKRRR